MRAKNVIWIVILIVPILVSVLKENASANRADPPKNGMFPIMRITENLLV